MQNKFEVFFHQKIPLINSSCPQQRNGYDCGVYVITLMEEFCRCIQENRLDEIHEKELLTRFINQIQRSITCDNINHQRNQWKILVESMSLEKNE